MKQRSEFLIWYQGTSRVGVFRPWGKQILGKPCYFYRPMVVYHVIIMPVITYILETSFFINVLQCNWTCAWRNHLHRFILAIGSCLWLNRGYDPNELRMTGLAVYRRMSSRAAKLWCSILNKWLLVPRCQIFPFPLYIRSHQSRKANNYWFQVSFFFFACDKGTKVKMAPTAQHQSSG